MLRQRASCHSGFTARRSSSSAVRAISMCSSTDTTLGSAASSGSGSVSRFYFFALAGFFAAGTPAALAFALAFFERAFFFLGATGAAFFGAVFARRAALA